MKNFTALFALVFLLSFSQSFYSQDTQKQNSKENPFRYPLEMEREPGNPTYSKVPLFTNTEQSLFFNINISQNSAPQNEPSVCISRKNPNRIVAAWRDFRYGIDPAANRRVGYSYSTNGGLTWAVSQILDSTLIPGATRNSDPVVTVDTAGNFYIAVIAIPFSGGGLILAVYKSTNGGVTFPQAFVCSQTGSEDKEWFATDLTPSSPFVNTLYISWTSFSLGGIRLTKSTNGGVNWSSPAVAVSNPAAPVQGSNLCVSRNGQVSVVWLGFSANQNIDFNRSTDGGVTFGTVSTIASGPDPTGLPNDVITCPWIAVDNSTGPRSGHLYVTFADNRNGDCDIFFCRSTNNGVSWSAPARINNDPIGNGKIQYWPVIAVNEVGNIAIMFMDTRNTANNTMIEAWVARSLDGGATFTNELVSNEPSPTNTPGSNVRFGDYIDIDYVGQNIVPVWTDERAGGNNMDIYTSEISELLAAGNNQNAIPNQYVLNQNYPNPFNPSTVISFGLPSASDVTIEIYNTLGQLVKTIAKGTYPAGNHAVKFNAGSLSSGVYFYKLISGSFTETKRMILLK
jgi:hypothetical protein